MEPIENPVLPVLAAYQAAVFAKDVDAYLALYDADVQVFDMWGAWSCRGIAAWRDAAAAWFGSLGTERVRVEFSELQSIVTPAMAVAHVFVGYEAVDAEGTALRSMDNRMTLVLAPAPGAWKIVHQHTSSPIDPKTVQVVFKR